MVQLLGERVPVIDEFPAIDEYLVGDKCPIIIHQSSDPVYEREKKTAKVIPSHPALRRQ
jgi:hypothetical protein